MNSLPQPHGIPSNLAIMYWFYFCIFKFYVSTVRCCENFLVPFSHRLCRSMFVLLNIWIYVCVHDVLLSRFLLYSSPHIHYLLSNFLRVYYLLSIPKYSSSFCLLIHLLIKNVYWLCSLWSLSEITKHIVIQWRESYEERHIRSK